MHLEQDILENCKHKETVIKIMKLIYKFYGIKTGAITKYFTGDMNLTHNILRRYLKKHDLVYTKPLIKEGTTRKEGAMIFLTQKGIKYLLNNGYVNYYRRAASNEVNGKLFYKLNALNDLYFSLPPEHWYGVPPREYKVSDINNPLPTASDPSKAKGARIHSNTYMDAVFHNIDTGTNYFTYYFRNSSKYYIRSVFNELVRHQKKLNDIILLCGTPEIFNHVQEKAQDKLGNNSISVYSMRVIPYPMAYFVFNRVLAPANFLEMIKGFYPDWKVITNPGQPFANFLLENNTRQQLLAEYLSRDLTIIDGLRRYTKEKYEFHQKPVNLLCWQEDVELLVDKLHGYHHIDITPINFNINHESR